MIWQFCYFLLAIRYCIVNTYQDSCECNGFPLITTRDFNDALIQSEVSVELFFCTNYTNAITINRPNRLVTLNTNSYIEVALNLSDYPPNIDLYLTNTHVTIQNISQNELITNSLTMIGSHIEMSNSILISPSFSADYQGYSNFNTVFCKEFTLIHFFPQSFSQNLTIELQPYDLDPQTVSVQYLANCNIYFENYSVILVNSIHLSIYSQTKMRVNLYVWGNEYHFDTNYDMYGTKFIPVNIYSYAPVNRDPVNLYFNGSFPAEISEDNLITIGSFSSNECTNIHIQSPTIPLSLDFYPDTQIFYYHNETTIYGSIFIHGNLTFMISVSNQDSNLTLRAKSVVQVDNTAFLNINPNFTLILDKFTSHHHIIGHRERVYYKNIDTSPGFTSLTNLYNNAHFSVEVYPLMTQNGLTSSTIFGSFLYQPESQNHVSVSFLPNNLFEDLYFYRSVLENKLDLVCNKVRFNCDNWIIEFDNRSSIHFEKSCGFNSNSLYCVSIQANNDLVQYMNQDIYVGDTLMHNSYDSIATEEKDYFYNIIDSYSSQYQIQIETDVTINLTDFPGNSNIYIRSHEGVYHQLRLIILSADQNLQFEKIVIENCNITLIGEKISANQIVFYNCLINNMENLTSIQLDTPNLCMPLSLYSSWLLNDLLYPSLSLFISNSELISVLFNSTSVTINDVHILNDNFNYLELRVSPVTTSIINYTIADNTPNIKGICLNLSDYETINSQRINSYVDLLFSGNWANVQTINSELIFDFANIITTLPDFPLNITKRIFFHGGSVQYNINRPLAIENPITIQDNFALNFMTDSIISFSELIISNNCIINSNQTITSNMITVNPNISVSSTSIDINSLYVGRGARININDTLNSNIIQYNFSGNNFPLITTSSFSSSSIILNFENPDNIVDFSSLIGENFTFLCSSNLNCAENVPKIAIISSELNVTNQTIQESYQFGCTKETYNRLSCLFASIQKDIEFVQPQPASNKKKVAAWIIAISIIIPLIVLTIIAIIIAVIYMRKTYGNGQPESENKKASPSKPRRQKVPIPIPPRKTLRPNPYNPQPNQLDEIEHTEKDNISYNDEENPSRTSKTQESGTKSHHSRRSKVRKPKQHSNVNFEDKSISSNSGPNDEPLNTNTERNNLQPSTSANNAKPANSMQAFTVYSDDESDDLPQVIPNPSNEENTATKNTKQDQPLQTIQTDDSELFQYDF